jgi:soluble lytic murein transglycosylase
LSLIGLCLLLGMGPASAQVTSNDALVLDARDAFRKRDRSRLAAARASALASQHTLAPWIDYWELNNRLGEVRQDEVDAFYARWPGSYVEDRLRNDWLLELGRRRDWANFTRDFPRFRMNDDREVTCYALLTDHFAGRKVHDAAFAAWTAQRDIDDGCATLATTLVEAGSFSTDDLWRAARIATEANRPRVARLAGTLISADVDAAVNDLFDSPARYLAKHGSVLTRTRAELTTLALMRLAASDPDAAAALVEQRWQHVMPAPLLGVVWSAIGRQAAFRLDPGAVAHYQRAWKAADKAAPRGQKAAPDWSDDTLAWGVRAALRAAQGAERWTMVQRAIDAMSAGEQRDPAWVYWKARAQLALATDGADGEAARQAARQALDGIAGDMSFYGALAAEDLGRPLLLPSRPAPPAPAEREAALGHAGLSRSLQMIAIGLRGEGVREWNYALRGMGDRELLSAAQLACDRQIWDRCINTSDRTRGEVDLQQRFPTPFRNDVLAKAREAGIDPAYVYGLIRQESRFVTDARSAVGASGLMQVMPTTARWTAQKLGIRYTPDMITDRDLNLRIGTGYLKLVLDDFGGSQALAAAAYNAGPSRPRRWREGAVLETAAWAENIPFNETRDYVKKVLFNATYYAALLSGQPPSLKARLGGPIGPREAAAPAPADLP